MDTLQQNTDLWRLIFKYLDYDSRINLNRVYPKTPVVRRLTKQQVQRHHVATVSEEVRRYIDLALALRTARSVTQALVQVIRPRYSPLLHFKRLRDQTIEKCNQFLPEVSEEYGTVLRKILEISQSKTEDFGEGRRLIIS